MSDNTTEETASAGRKPYTGVLPSLFPNVQRSPDGVPVPLIQNIAEGVRGYLERRMRDHGAAGQMILNISGPFEAPEDVRPGLYEACFVIWGQWQATGANADAEKYPFEAVVPVYSAKVLQRMEAASKSGAVNGIHQ